MDFNTGDAVWFTPPGGTYPVPGEVLEFHRQGNVLTILSLDEDNAGHYTVDNNGSVRKRNSEVLYEDMIGLSDLSEAALLWNIKKRYSNGMIYTYIGSILIAVNPYKMYEIYGQPVVKQYEGQVLGSLPPHLFAIGSSAYSKMVKDSASQVVVISGESGSGKTESTKLILGYLALVNKSPSNLITEQILEASPLLESFGNAKTSKNDNSSRFGKYIQVYFENGRITGSRITEYLLEKSRIVTQASDERNYHVFYEILKGLSREQKELYGLTSAEKYFYLNQGGNCSLQSDASDFNALMSAFQILGFSSDETDVILRILASVLHLGNVYFHRKSMKHGQEGVEIGSDAEIQWVAHLLQIHPDGIRKCLTTKITEARRERLATPLSIDQSLDSRDAIAKVLYSSLFTWLVSRVNRIVFKGESKSINILDIFGFEVFQDNSFEQLCINYANESLQHYLNKHIFKLEQLEYAKEKIDWVPISYNDNLSVINLLSKKPIGILHLLDDESNFPKGTDTSFLEKAHYNHALNESYARPRMNCNEFGIKHYAGSVMYTVEGFLEKNRDTLRPDVVKLLGGSGSQMISKMFHLGASNSARSPKSGRFVTVKPRAPTVAARFHDSLQSLLVSMSKCSPWFVRCIKPNCTKQAGFFDVPVVLEQIRYAGLLETIRIRKLGYPSRMPYADFALRYKCLVKPYSQGMDPRDITGLVLRDTPHGEFQPGITKIFLRESLEQKLEQRLHDLYHNSTVLLQKTVRGYLARKRFKRMKMSAVVIQAVWRGKRERKFYQDLKRSAVVLQRGWRKVRRKRVARKTRSKVRGCVVSGVNHLEVPAELALILSKLDDWHPPHTERNLVKLVGEVSKKNKLLLLPPDIDSCSLSKYIKENVKTQVLGMKREPISIPFLANSPQEESVAMFKLILRLMNDVNCLPVRQQAITNYLIRKSLESVPLQDEVLIQIVNQTVGNKDEENCERGYFLLSNALSSLKPSRALFRPLLKYVSDSSSVFSHQLQQKLLAQTDTKFREFAPTLLEWRCNKVKANAALTVYYADGEYSNIEVNSWTSVSELAETAAEVRLGEGTYGWALELEESEVEGLVFDVIASIEAGGLFLSSPTFLFGKEEKKTRSLEDLADSYGLSESKLNNRYRSSEKIWDEHSSHLPPPRMPSMNQYDDDKASFLDEPSEDPTYGTTGYADSDIMSARTSEDPRLGQRSGHPRFIKASAKRSSVTGSYSSRAYIERMGEVKSSAMSDTSEAPSLASHVRRVRVPSQASDVEQFLDDLFSPLLDGNLDDLSDARSLIQSIKGGEPAFAQFGFSPSPLNVHPQDYNNMQRAFLQSAMAQNIQIQQQLIAQNNALQKLLEREMDAKAAAGPSTSRGPPVIHTTKNAVNDSQPFIPPPPPLPPDLIEGSRPFVDPYGRAKTVRIGKWRWPPAPDDNFAEMMKEAKSKSNTPETSLPPPQPLFVHKVARPFGDAVGKLKISSEMRMKLEQVTSVRGTSPTKMSRDESIIPKKIGEDRKSMLAEKLGGVAPPPPPPPPIISPPAFPQIRDQIPFATSNPERKEVMEFIPPPRPPMQKVVTPNHAPFFTYNRVPWAFRLRKEVFAPGETSTPLTMTLIFIQIVRDTFGGNIRISGSERSRMRSILDQYDLSLATCGQAKFNVKKSVVGVAKEWLLYFNKFWRVETTTEAKYIAANALGVKLVKKAGSNLHVLDNFGYERISSVYAENGRLQISLINGMRMNFYSRTADDIEHWIGIFSKTAAVPSPDEEVDSQSHLVQNIRHSSPAHVQPPPTSDGKHSLLQFAMEHFRRDKFRLGGPPSNSSWTWAEQVAMVKYSQSPIEQSLLPLDDVNNRLAVECYISIMKYMGDYGGGSGGNEMEAVYTLLRNCHGSPPLRDELYCQMMKQTTNNNKTAQRGWRLFTILSAYFTCSEELKPYLFKYLESAAYDKRRAYHGTALVTLQNLRKTFKYGGRRNVPSVEEITAITAGRNAKRQIFRLPGGTQRVLNVKGSTVVKDIIEEMCGLLNITRVEEREEFSIYCIVEGDTFTMPLMKEEYILDVTTELYKNDQIFYLIFCRSVWFFPLKLDSEPYVEVVFNQVAPDYLEGLLLVMPNGNLREDDVHDVARIAALLHRAAELTQAPTLKETKYLLPKPALAARDVKPNQWVNLVQSHWDGVRGMSSGQAKAKVLEILQSWSLFGSSFFSVRRIVDPSPPEEYIMALNKNGVHFLDPVTHEPLSFSPYNEIISTRKVKNEEGVLYLDLKFGNLMQQRISRVQTEHAHEISRLIRMYIYIKKGISN